MFDDAKKSSHNVHEILKQLRPKFPPDVTRLKVPGFVYSNGLVSIELVYYCAWQQPTKVTERECYPTLIKIRPVKKRDAVGARNYRPKQDGHFNYNAIAAAVTNMTERIQEHEATEAKHEQQYEARQQRRDQVLRRVLRSTGLRKPKNLNFGYQRYKIAKHLQLGIQANAVHNHEDELISSVSLEIENLTEDEARKVLEYFRTLN